MKVSHAQLTTPEKQNLNSHASNHSMKRYIEYVMANSTTKTVQLDFSNVSKLDSTGLACLVYLYKYLTSHHRRMVINNVTGQPLFVMTQLNVDKVIKINPPAIH